MASVFTDLHTLVQQADMSGLVLCGLAALAAAVLHALQRRFQDKGAAGALALGKWFFMFLTVYFVEERVLGGRFTAAAYAGYCLVAWMAFRVLLHDLYAGIYLTRIKRHAPNKLLLNLLSFLGMLVLLAVGLRSVFHIDVGALLTSSAILTAVVGFSMQDTIGSLFSGLLIQTEKPFKRGDWIKVGDMEGQVTEITWRYTKLVTVSSNQLVIPNNAIAKERLLNLSEPTPEVMVALTVPAPLDVPPVKVKSALEDVLRKAQLLSPVPAPRVRLYEIGEDQILYRVIFSVQDYAESISARSEVLSSVWYEFKKCGIAFPMPRRMLTGTPKAHAISPENIVGLVKDVGLFTGMPPEDITLLAECSAARSFPPAARIVEQGQSGSTMFIIVRGQVAVESGGKEITRLGPGEVFGEMALLTGEPRQADVVALEPVSCLEVDREAFRGVLEKNPLLVENVNRIFREREALRTQHIADDKNLSAQGLFETFRRIFW